MTTAASTSFLLGCPFCGEQMTNGRDLGRERAEHPAHGDGVRCAGFPLVVYLDDPHQVAAWNRRSLPRSEAEVASLDERMVAAGMVPLSTILSGEGVLKQWMAHAGVVDLETFEQWLLMRYRELLVMRIPYELGDKDKTDELYEWVLGHAGAFSEVTANFRAMKERAPASAIRKQVVVKSLTWDTDPWGKPRAISPAGAAYGLEMDENEQWVILCDGNYLHAPVHGFIRSFALDDAKAFVETHHRARVIKALEHLDRDPRDILKRAAGALKPFSDAVFNDNGDMTVDRSVPKYDDFVEAYRALRSITLEAGSTSN